MSKPLINISRRQALWFSAFLVLYQFLTYIAILGNWYLRKLTHRYNVKQIIVKGTGIITIGLLVSWALPFLVNTHFHYLMPGLIIYGFGLGVTGSPLSRFVLFSTSVSKGTAYAVMSLVSMCTQAIGVEIANLVYAHHSNSHFGLYCAIVGIVFLMSLVCTYSLSKQDADGMELGSKPA